MSYLKVKYHIQNFLAYTCIVLLLLSCDFTPQKHRKIMQAQNLLVLQKYDQAVKIYEDILKYERDPIIASKLHFQLAEIYLLHYAQYKKAIYYLNLIRDDNPNINFLIKAEEKKANINFSFLHNYQEARDSYKHLSEFYPSLPRFEFYQLRYAQSLIFLGHYQEAIKVLNKLLTSKKYKEEALYFQARSYYFMQQWKLAIKYMNKFLAITKSYNRKYEGKFLIANSYENLEDLKKAYDIYYSILSEYPNVEVIKNKLNSIYIRKISRKR